MDWPGNAASRRSNPAALSTYIEPEVAVPSSISAICASKSLSGKNLSQLSQL
jgi:hypothetical protein